MNEYLVGAAGSEELLNLLSTSADPRKAIADFQQKNALRDMWLVQYCD